MFVVSPILCNWWFSLFVSVCVCHYGKMGSWGHISQREPTQKGFWVLFPGVCLFVRGQILSARRYRNRSRRGEETLQVCGWGQTWGEIRDGCSLSDGSQRAGGRLPRTLLPLAHISTDAVLKLSRCVVEITMKAAVEDVRVWWYTGTDINCDTEKGIVVSVIHLWQYCVNNLTDVRPRESFINQVIWFIVIFVHLPSLVFYLPKKERKCTVNSWKLKMNFTDSNIIFVFYFQTFCRYHHNIVILTLLDSHAAKNLRSWEPLSDPWVLSLNISILPILFCCLFLNYLQ